MSQLPEDPMPQVELDEIKALYRDAAGEQPSAAHDAAVMAAMQTELAAARRAKARPVRRWQLPVALAATVVLTVALTFTVEREQRSAFETMPRAPVQLAPGSAAPAGNARQLPPQGATEIPGENAPGVAPRDAAGKPAAPAPKQFEAQEKAYEPPALLQEQVGDKAASTPAASPSALPSSISRYASPAPGKEQSILVPSAPGVNAARAGTELRQSGVRGDSVAQPAGGANAAIVPTLPVQGAPPVTPHDALDAAKPAAPAPPAYYESKPDAIMHAAPAPPPAPKPEPAPRAFVPPPTAASPAPLAAPEVAPREVEASRQRARNIAAPVMPPHEWLGAIRGLKQAGKNAEAEADLRKFRLAYPDYPVPADLLPPARP